VSIIDLTSGLALLPVVCALLFATVCPITLGLILLAAFFILL
jgi:hypothetical protein